MEPAFLTPIRLKVSFRRLPLILRSKGLSNARDGDKLTSRSHGLKLKMKIFKLTQDCCLKLYHIQRAHNNCCDEC